MSDATSVPRAVLNSSDEVDVIASVLQEEEASSKNRLWFLIFLLLSIYIPNSSEEQKSRLFVESAWGKTLCTTLFHTIESSAEAWGAT